MATKKAPAPPAPTDAELTAALGKARRYWDKLVDQARALSAKITGSWKYYAGSGWTYVLRDQRRNVMYLKAGAGRFSANFALGDAAVAALPEAELPPDIVAAIKAGPRYPEGRAARFEVASAAQCAVAGNILVLKLSH
jgi:hypothetical protein